MTQIEIKAFAQFLKRHGVYDEYRYYIRNSIIVGNCSSKEYSSYELYLHSIDSFNALQHAFCWANTKEGDAYWRNLNDIWRIMQPL